jgi:hypothetical protein
MIVARGALLIIAAFVAGAAAAAPPGSANVPFVGCPSDGQTGPQPPPVHREVPRVGRAAAASLAFYASGDLGVLAPRGWHCFGLYGSNGSILIVTPQNLGARELLSPESHPLRGPVVQVALSLGGTSGRFEVARVIARAFPAQMAFARRVEAEGIDGPFPTGPYTSDRMVRLRPLAVGYTTPAGRQGLGTDSRLVPDDRPIDGLAILDTSEDWSLIKIDVRLAATQASLATAILNSALPPRPRRR